MEDIGRFNCVISCRISLQMMANSSRSKSVALLNPCFILQKASATICQENQSISNNTQLLYLRKIQYPEIAAQGQRQDVKILNVIYTCKKQEQNILVSQSRGQDTLGYSAPSPSPPSKNRVATRLKRRVSGTQTCMKKSNTPLKGLPCSEKE